MANELPLLSDVFVDPLVMGVVHGDRAAWFQLTLTIEVWVEQHVPRHWRMRRGRLANSQDDVRDVLLATLERLDRDDFAVLREYVAKKLSRVPDVREPTQEASELSFVAWLAALVDFVIRDHVRSRYGRVSGSARLAEAVAPAPSKRSLQSWAFHPHVTLSVFGSAAPQMSRLLTARAVLSYAAEAFDARELALLQRYLEQATFEELSDAFDLSGPDEARAHVRKLKERLRARFREHQ